MPSAPYPTLSELGYIRDPQQKIEWIFADYIAAKHSQSTLMYGIVSSLSYDEYAGNYEGYKTAEIIQNSLSKLYSAYFDTANVQVTDDSVEGSKETRVIIRAVLTDNGKEFQLNETLTSHNGIINRIGSFNR